MLLLNTVGILVIRSATGAESFRDAYVVRQIMGSLAGAAMCIGLSLIDYRKIVGQARLIYLFCVAMLAAVLVYGTASGHAAVRWIQVPVLGQIQPSEFVKVGLIIFFAAYFMKAQGEINQPQVIGMAFLYYLLPIVLILMQPNMSTSIIITIIIAAVVFVSPISYKWIFGVIGALIPVGGIFAALFSFKLYDRIPFLQGYQAQRILTFLDPQSNTQTYYQQANSIMAIGSGQLMGKGLNNTSIFSVKNGDFLVEQDNDFIFSVIGEELGFRGSVIIIIIFLLIILECLIIASRAKNLSGRLICVGMAAWIGFQTFTNIAVATGIFPNTGITLPFFSRGVSSLAAVYMGMGIVLNIALQRKT